MIVSNEKKDSDLHVAEFSKRFNRAAFILFVLVTNSYFPFVNSDELQLQRLVFLFAASCREALGP